MRATLADSGAGGGVRISWGQGLVLTGVLLAGSALFLASERIQAHTWGFPLDDSWIHCRYAQNLTGGWGFSHNPGEVSNGSTAPLWTLVVAGAYAVTGEFPLTLKLIGLALVWGSCLLTVGVILQLLGKPKYALAGGLGVALMPPMLWGALSGMEVALYALLVMAVIYTYIATKDTPGWRRLLPTFLSAAAVATRPELGAIFVFLLIDRWVAARSAGLARRRVSGEIGLHIVVFCLLLTPYAWYNWRVTGLPYPNTYAAKVSQQWSGQEIGK